MGISKVKILAALLVAIDHADRRREAARLQALRVAPCARLVNVWPLPPVCLPMDRTEAACVLRWHACGMREEDQIPRSWVLPFQKCPPQL